MNRGCDAALGLWPFGPWPWPSWLPRPGGTDWPDCLAPWGVVEAYPELAGDDPVGLLPLLLLLPPGALDRDLGGDAG